MKTDIQDEATEAQDALSFILLNIRLVQTPIHGVSGGMYVQKWGIFRNTVSRISITVSRYKNREESYLGLSYFVQFANYFLWSLT